MDGYNRGPDGEPVANGHRDGAQPAGKHIGGPAAYIANGHYQQWLPTQFAQFSLGPYHPSAAYYPAPHPVQPVTSVPPQQFMPAPLPPPPSAHEAAPRGWGGMQIQDQRDGRGVHGRCGPGRM
jgi:hypothetical protein